MRIGNPARACGCWAYTLLRSRKEPGRWICWQTGTTAGPRPWPPRTGSAIGLANRPCHWLPACAANSASARTRTRQDCQGRRASKRLLRPRLFSPHQRLRAGELAEELELRPGLLGIALKGGEAAAEIKQTGEEENAERGHTRSGRNGVHAEQRRSEE